MNPLDLLIIALAVCRCTRLVVDDAWPFGWVRARLEPGSWPWNLTSCQWCFSVWMGTAWTFGYLWGYEWAVWTALPLALSQIVGMVSWVER